MCVDLQDLAHVHTLFFSFFFYLFFFAWLKERLFLLKKFDDALSANPVSYKSRDGQKFRLGFF